MLILKKLGSNRFKLWLGTSMPFISSVIIGANNMKQLEDNLKSVEVNLTAEEVVAIDEMTTHSPIYPGWMQGMGNDPKITDALS
ncbi:aldo/keto reductase [Microcystis aeruginosa]|jgi:diketogulonate reductase-like aldo/keto reductase|uniref:aldo/keto reductase n=2 Tax=Microcystaceae TaxID=1890449 RepID=UPI00068488A8